MICERDAEKFKILKQSKEYNELLESKRVYFEETYNRYYKWKKAEREKAEKEKADNLVIGDEGGEFEGV
ncbi:hypothetical protein Bca4012_068913 [Brassica carinata]